MRLVCQYYVIRNIFNIVNPIHGCGVEITPDINPIYDGLERSCRTCVDLILSFGWGGVRWPQ